MNSSTITSMFETDLSNFKPTDCFLTIVLLKLVGVISKAIF